MTTPGGYLPVTRPVFGEEEVAAVRRCLESGWVTQGPMTAALEERFARRHQVAHALACSNGTAALHIAMLALGVGPGDEVVVPSFTWVTCAHAAEYVGARPVFCDIDPATFNVDVASMEAAVTPRTRALMPVHLFGLAADMDAVNRVASRHHLAVIEDAACAVGTVYRGRPVGALGSIGCFSLHPRKVVTTGEGGVLTTDDADLAAAIGRLRNHGASPGATGQPYELGPFHHVGFNYRLSDIQAAVGVAQMDRLDGLVAERQALAGHYGKLLKAVSWIGRPAEPDGYQHTYQSYVVWVARDAPRSRNEIMLELERQGIQTRPGTLAVHATGFYREKYKLGAEQCPVAFQAQEHTLTLPLFPGMTVADQQRVVDTLRAIDR